MRKAPTSAFEPASQWLLKTVCLHAFAWTDMRAVLRVIKTWQLLVDNMRTIQGVALWICIDARARAAWRICESSL